jgi:hypothetical protein
VVRHTKDANIPNTALIERVCKPVNFGPVIARKGECRSPKVQFKHANTRHGGSINRLHYGQTAAKQKNTETDVDAATFVEIYAKAKQRPACAALALSDL